MGLALTGYNEALERLFARTTGASKLGLERTLALLDRLGNPHERFPSFHIAGTNGKGSVATTAETLLRAKALRVGKYTSPHLVDFRERIVVDGAPIGPADVVAFIDRWTPDIERLGATFFEATTALAFDYLARAAVDVAVIEVGLGGRLDSTNVIRPLAAAVVSIGLDHTEYLGGTLEAIAGEKAGVFKAGVPAVIGEPAPAIRDLLGSLARTAGAHPVRMVTTDWAIEDIEVRESGTTFRLTTDRDAGRLTTPLVGAHQASNCATALALLESGGPRYATRLADAARALPAVALAGRFERRGRYVFDVAHNRDGAAVLARTIRAVALPAPVAIVLCVLRDKDWQGIMEELAPVADHFLLTTAPSAPESRAWRLADATAYAKRRGYAASAEPSLARALAEGARVARTVVVTGSFHTAGDAMRCLQAAPLDG